MVMIAAIPKAPHINGTADPVQSNFILDLTTFSSPVLQTALNFDPITTDDPAWFLWLNGSPTGGKFYYNRLKWTHGFAAVPEWQDSPWGQLTLSQSYYVLVFGGITARQLGNTKRVRLAQQVSSLMMAMVRNIGGIQYLWTCRQIGVNSAGNNDDGLADRSAVEWFRIQTTPSVTTPPLSGRIYDTAASNFKFYYMPSLVVNQKGDMVVGFSGSSESEYISAYYAGRLNNWASAIPPIRYGRGKDWYNSSLNFRWGDYSYTSLDPDGLTMWTIQQCAGTRYDSSLFTAWGTWIGATSPF